MGSGSGAARIDDDTAAEDTRTPFLTTPDLDATERVLIVDDDAGVVRTLARVLRSAGIDDVVIETDPRLARRRHDATDYDAILLDLHMPEVDGFDLLSSFVRQIGEDDYLPVLVLTGDVRAEVRERALESGAKDFLRKPFEPTEVVARVRNLIHTTRMHRRLRSFNDVLAARVREQTADLRAAKMEVLERLARAGEYRDDMTGRHAQRVGTLCGMLAREICLEEEYALQVEWAAPLHDIGKIGVPDRILLKKGKLTHDELKAVRRHTVIGGAILSGSMYPVLRTAESIALTHHEFWNGSGYPRGLAGCDIPLGGRLTAVADAFDSITNDRPYRRAASTAQAVKEILEWRGRQFDPQIVDALERHHESGMLTEIEERTMRRRDTGRVRVGSGPDAGASSGPFTVLT